MPTTHSDAAHRDPAEFAVLLRALSRGKWIIVATMFLVIGLTAAYTVVQDPEFESSSVVLVDASDIKSETPSSSYDPGERVSTPEERRFYNQLEILRKSLPIAERVADSLLSVGRAPKSGAALPVLTDESGAARWDLEDDPSRC